MNTTPLHTSQIPEELLILQKTLLGKVKKQHDHYLLSMDTTVGKGYIRYQDLQPGLKAIDLQLVLKDDVELPIDKITTETLQFIFCLEGHFYHQFENNFQITPIEQYQTGVAHSDNGLLSSIYIKKNIPLTLNVILIDKKEYFDKLATITNQFDQKIQQLLSTISREPSHFHAGKYSIKIAEQVKLVMGVEHTNEIAELLSQKGRYYLILAKQIEQLCSEMDDHLNTSGLLKTELKSIAQTSDFIKEKPEIPHSVKSLCQFSGLSPAKLQEGFKFVAERTVSDFVRHIRLEKAEFLIRTTDLTISEVVYSVGLTSRSYFCKIFKQKNNLSPKEYKKKLQHRQTNTTA